MRVCKYCNKSDAMVQVLDKKLGIVSERYRVCFECQPSMDSGDYTDLSLPRALSGDDGDLNYLIDDTEEVA